ncbi:MAG: hypothetical protein ACREKI_04530 [Gemmatimonadota bacterium]
MTQPQATTRRAVPWFLWPFAALWDLLAIVLRLTGRVVAGVLGFALMMLGLVATLTVVGAPVGIPFIVLGFLLMLRSVF